MERPSTFQQEQKSPLPSEVWPHWLQDDPRWSLAQRIVASAHFSRSPLLSKFLLFEVAETLEGRASEIAEHATDYALTPREIDVLQLIAKGNANKEVARILSLTEETIKGHVKNILAKLGANDRTHAVTIGLKRGIIDL